MRKIKFRGVGLNDGKYYYGWYVEITPTGKFPAIIDAQGYYHEVDEDSVKQLCGYDGDGEEIYEGDELTYTEYIEEDEDYEDEIEYKGKAYLEFKLVEDKKRLLTDTMGAKLEDWYKVKY